MKTEQNTELKQKPKLCHYGAAKGRRISRKSLWDIWKISISGGFGITLCIAIVGEIIGGCIIGFSDDASTACVGALFSIASFIMLIVSWCMGIKYQPLMKMRCHDLGYSSDKYKGSLRMMVIAFVIVAIVGGIVEDEHLMDEDLFGVIAILAILLASSPLFVLLFQLYCKDGTSAKNQYGVPESEWVNSVTPYEAREILEEVRISDYQGAMITYKGTFIEKLLVVAQNKD